MKMKEKRGLGRIAYFAAISIALLFAVLGWFVSKRGESGGAILEFAKKVTKLFSSKRQLSEEQREKVKLEIRKIFEDAKNQDVEIYNSTVSRMEEHLRNGSRRAKNNISNVIDRTCTFKQSAKICFLIAKDTANGSNELDEHLSGIIVPNIVHPMQKAASNCENELARMEDSLRENRTNVNVRIISISHMAELRLEDNLGLENALKELLKATHGPSSDITDIAKIKVSSAIGLASDAISIRSTVACFRSVLGHIARRMGVTVPSSIVSAAADGPLPIGDAIAVVISVGGATWCAYDLYKANIQIPGKIRTELWSSIERSRKEILDSGRSRAKAILEAHESHLSNTEQKVLSEIDKEL